MIIVSMRLAGLVLLWLCVTVVTLGGVDLDLDSVEEVENSEDEVAQMMMAGIDLDSLPVIRREKSVSRLCPLVEDEVVYRRLDHEVSSS